MAKQTSWIGALVGALLVTTTAAAQDRRPFQHGTVGIEAAVAPLVEIWNLNGHREPMLEVSAAFWGAVSDRFLLGVEFQHGFVFQHTPGAFVQGISPLLRWRFADTPAWDWFVEAGPGASWSDLDTPPRGTRFNYLLLAGSGLARRLGRQSHAIVGFRWLHVSNNGREGRGRNPDIEALGGYAGVSLSFAE